MKFQDIPANILTVRVRRTDNISAVLQEQPVFSVAASRTRLNEFEIRLKDSLILAQPIVDADVRRLNSELSSARAILAQLINPAADGSIELHIAFFAGECVEMGDVEVAVDSYVENTLAKLERRKTALTGTYLSRMLDQLCCLRHADSMYFFVIAGPAIDRELEPELSANETQNDDSNETGVQEQAGQAADAPDTAAIPDAATEMEKPQPTRRNSFCVTGDNIRFVATETRLPDGRAVFTVTRLTSNQQRLDRAVRLARGKLTFVDWTQAGHIQVLARAQMTALTKDDGSYLKKWDEFGNLEGERLLKRAREVGVMQYCDTRHNRDGTVTVTISQASPSAFAALEDGVAEQAEVVSTLPDYLLNAGLSFRDFAGSVEQEERIRAEKEARSKTKDYKKPKSHGDEDSAKTERADTTAH